MLYRSLRIIPLSVLVALCACDEPLCGLSAGAGLRIRVRNSVSSIPLFGDTGARVIARSGAVADTAPILASDVYLLHGSLGMFFVSVEYPGYQLWTRSNVVVTKDGCNVRRTDLTADLEPL